MIKVRKILKIDEINNILYYSESDYKTFVIYNY